MAIQDVTESYGFMSPEHPRWEEFTERLNGPEGCDFQQTDPDDVKTVRWRCGAGKDKSYSEKILKDMGFSQVFIVRSFEFFEENGGHCDCEILFNVDR